MGKTTDGIAGRAQSDKAARRAEALRENLRRRKAQARARKADDAERNAPEGDTDGANGVANMKREG